MEALFVLRQAFKTELVIRRKDLLAMFMDSLEELSENADFTEEAEEEGETESSALENSDYEVFHNTLSFMLKEDVRLEQEAEI